MRALSHRLQAASGDPSRRVRETGREQGQLAALHSLLHLQQTAGNQAVGRLLQAKLKVNQPGDEYEREADSVAEFVMRMPEREDSGFSRTSTKIQRQAKGREAVSPQAATSIENAASTLIAEDSAETLAPGQIRKSEFLAQLRSQVCKTADEAMANADKSSKGCPYVESWFDFYSKKDSRHIERALRKFAPETARAKAARDYIPIVSARVRRSVERWAKTGEITGVPEELLSAMPEGGILGALGSLASGISGAVSSLAGGVEKGISAAGRLFFKDRAGSSRDGGDSQAILSQLGHGRPLDGGVRSRMESAFGMSFSGVRMHADSSAAKLSESLNARAFTVGEHVAFSAGEYQPGTLIGEALIAHELAHVAQQGGGSYPNRVMQKGSSDYNALEEDADVSAVSAIVSAWGGVKGGLKIFGKSAMPRLRSRLRLQRCTQKGTEAGPKADDKRFAEIKKILETIPTGKEALKIMADRRVSVKFHKGSYYYDPASNTVIIDLDHDLARSALDFAHEINHAKYEKEGLAANVNTLSREEYVKKRVEEEAEGTVKSIEAKIELEGTTIDVSNAIFPLEVEYKAAYKTAADAAKAADPSKSAADLKKIGQEAGLKRVIKGFTDGEVKTSTTIESYPDYYGKIWDEAHKGGK